MDHASYPDNYIREILNGVKSIAMVGASPVNVRPSYFAFKYLAQRGYDMIPVNPGHVGKSLLGKPFVASLRDIGHPVDMVDIFRNSSHIMPVVDEALKMTPLPKVIWMQLGARFALSVRELTPIHEISEDSRPYSILGQRFMTTLRPTASAFAAAASSRAPSCIQIIFGGGTSSSASSTTGMMWLEFLKMSTMSMG